MKVLVISDVHLKPHIFDRADKILESGQADMAVQIGDLTDDWGQGHNLPLYSRTLQRALKFHKDHPNTKWVMGNHDYGYWFPSMGVTESGHSKFAEGECKVWYKELEKYGGEQMICHIIDGVIFTHGGLTKDWVKRQADMVQIGRKDLNDEALLRLVNLASMDELWQENSPLWARPQHDVYEMYPCKLQVVGHTPMKDIGEDNDVLSTDVFSTYQDGSPIGSERFAIVETKSGTWTFAKEPDVKRIITDKRTNMFMDFFVDNFGVKFVDEDTEHEIVTMKDAVNTGILRRCDNCNCVTYDLMDYDGKRYCGKCHERKPKK